MSKFSIRMKELRLQRKYTQDDMAEKLGVSKSAISMWENDNREPDFEMQEAIADLFNVDMDYLFGRSTPTPTPLSTDEVYIMDKYRGFNDEGKGKVTAYIDDLDKIGIYKK